MKLIGIVAVLAVAAGATSSVAAGAAVQRTAQAGAALRQFKGTVVSVSREARRFRLRDSERADCASA